MDHKSEHLYSIGLVQMAEWANTWVENHTTISEMPLSEMPASVAATLALIGAILEKRG